MTQEHKPGNPGWNHPDRTSERREPAPQGALGSGGPARPHLRNGQGKPLGGMPPRGSGRPFGPPPPRRRRVVLPFEKTPADPASWVYEHQVGLLSMIAALLIVGIVFVTAQIVIVPARYAHTIYVDLEDMLPEPEQKPLTPEERQQLEESLRSARNQISNEDSPRETQQQIARNNPVPSDMAQRAEEVQERVRASREAYEQGLRDEQAMIDASKNRPDQHSEPQEQTKVKGNVVISFSLEGRSFVYMHVPAYQCEGGGEIVVTIAVDRNGKVVNSSVQTASTSDDCIVSRALEAARLSRFNVDGSAPERQQGTITYLFVPQ